MGLMVQDITRENNMTYPLLLNAPDHLSAEFITYLRENNVVIHEDAHWLVIENCKYHTTERAWHTAFWKNDACPRRAVPSFHSKMYGGW